MGTRFKRLAGHVLSGVIAGVTVVAGLAAIAAYRSPSSFPVVRGIDIVVCRSAVDDETSLPEQARFLGELQRFNQQLVFVTDMTIYNYNCFDSLNPSRAAKIKKMKENENFELLEDDLNGDMPDLKGSITVGFSKMAKTKEYLMNEIALTVRAPGNDQYLTDIGCGENCFGAHGLYKVTFAAAEGTARYRLDPFPATSAILDAYQCTLNKLQAKSSWERFVACRF
jgi:hypothetical protein